MDHRGCRGCRGWGEITFLIPRIFLMRRFFDLRLLNSLCSETTEQEMSTSKITIKKERNYTA